MKTIDSLRTDLLAILKKYKEKPYLPVWGELFSILKDVKKIARKQKSNLTFYEINPMGFVRYDYKKDIFVIEVPDLNINIKDDEFVDSLINGRFKPKQ